MNRLGWIFLVRTLFGLVILSTTQVPPALAEEFLVYDGAKLQAALEIPENPTEEELLAAKELTEHILLITGKSLQYSRAGRSNGPVIRLGSRIAPRAQALLATSRSSSSDGFAMIVDQRGVELAGKGSSGTLIATYELRVLSTNARIGSRGRPMRWTGFLRRSPAAA